MSTSKDLSAYVARLEAKAIAKPAKAAALEAKLDAKIASLIAKGKTVVIDGATVTSYNLDTSGSSGGGSSGGGSSGTTGSTYTLTNSSNTTTGGVDIVNGTDNNDTFNGLVLGSLDNSDVLDGKGGTDTINARFDNSTAGANTRSVTPVLSNIEIINITGFDADNAGDAVTFNGSNVTGAQKIIVKNDSSTTAGDVLYTISNVSKDVASGVDGGQVSAAGTGLGGDITVSYSASSVAGTTDAATFYLGQGQAGYANVVTIAGIETLTVDANDGGGRIADLTAAAAKTINIVGDNSVTLATVANSTAVTKISAATATGAVTIGASGATILDGTTTVLGGSGNDTLWFTSSRIASTDSIDAGSGTDTLGLAGGLSASITVNNFEKLRVGDAGQTYDLSKIGGTGTSISAIRVDTTGGNATFSSVASGTAVQVTGDAGGVLSFTGVGTTGSVTVDLDNGTGKNADGVDVTTGTFTNFATLNLTSNDTNASLTGTNANSIGGLGVATVNIAATARTEVTSTRTTAVTLNAADSTARVDITATATSAASITGGSNNDSITAGSGNDVISGGAGNDTIVGATGNDNLSGGDGDDTFTFSTLASITAADTIVGGAGVDVIRLTEDADQNLTTDTTLYTGISGVERIALANSTNARTLTVNDSTVSQFGGNLTIVLDGDKGHTIALGSIGSSSSLVTINGASQTTAGITLQIGSGTETMTGFSAALNDTVTAASAAFLQSTDFIDAGAGTNTFTFLGGTTATTTTVTAAQLSALRNFSTISVNDGTDADTSRFDITLSDTVLSQNNASNVLTISRDSADSGILKVTGSAVTAGYSLTLTGAAGADTLIGGAGSDTIGGGVNDSAIDSLTGGAGNDVFALDDAAIDIITDFDFGTSTTSVDTFLSDISDMGLNATVTLDTSVDTVTVGTATSHVAGTDVLVITDQAYANAAALDTALEALNGVTMTNDMLVVYQDTLGVVRIAIADFTTAAQTNGAGEVTTVDLAKLTGVTLTGISSLINTSDFTNQA